MEFPFATLGRRWVMRIPSDSQIGAQLIALNDDQVAFNIAVATAYDSLVAVGITPESKEPEVIEKLASLNGNGRTEVAILEPNPIKETIMDALARSATMWISRISNFTILLMSGGILMVRSLCISRS